MRPVSIKSTLLLFLLIYNFLVFRKFEKITTTATRFPAGNHTLKFNNRDTGARWEICSKLTVKTPGGVFIVNFEHISHLVVMLLLLTLRK